MCLIKVTWTLKVTLHPPKIAKSLALWPYAGLPATGALVSQWSSSVSQPQNGARHTESKSDAFRRFADRLPLGQTPSFSPTDSATEGMGLRHTAEYWDPYAAAISASVHFEFRPNRPRV